MPDHSWTGYIPKDTTTKKVTRYASTTTTTELQQIPMPGHHSEVFSIHGSDSAIATIHSPFLAQVQPTDDGHVPTTTQMAISLHTTMRLLDVEAQEPRSWVIGAEKVSCDHVCLNAGGCVEGGWPRNENEFLNIVNGLGYSCFDLQAGGGKYDPSTQQGNCGWSWNGGEGKGVLASATRCAAEAPAFTRRFCPCRSVPKSGQASSGRKVEDHPDLVIEKFSMRQRSLQESLHDQSKPPIFT